MIRTYSLKKDGETNITPNFKVREFRCKCGSDTIIIDTNLVINILQKIREKIGKPIVITSGYRTAEYNKKVGGAQNSYHIKGQAFDIQVVGIAPKEIAKIAEQVGCRGICYYTRTGKAGWTHIDSRTTKWFAHDDNKKVTTLNTFL